MKEFYLIYSVVAVLREFESRKVSEKNHYKLFKFTIYLHVNTIQESMRSATCTEVMEVLEQLVEVFNESNTYCQARRMFSDLNVTYQC